MTREIWYTLQTDDYTISDKDGEMRLSLSDIKNLLNVVKRTHPELLQKVL